MTSTQDASIGMATEGGGYGTNTTVTRWLEFTDESLDFNKNTKQGMGMRVGGRVARSPRRVVPTADAGGDFTVEMVSKGLGLLLQACFGAATSTLVSGSTFQQLFTLGDNPTSLTIQKGVVEAGLTVDAYTYIGCMVDSWELNCPNGDIATLKTTVDAKDITTATAYASPSYASGPNLFHFANGSIASGTLTAPTTTALAAGTTQIADVRTFNLKVNNNLKQDRYNFGGGGRKAKPTVGLRQISGTMDVEYDNTTFRDAVLGDTPMLLILNFVTAQALSTGVETLQIVLPEVKFDTELAKVSGTDLVIQNMAFQVLDNLSAAQPIWGVMRTADAAL